MREERIEAHYATLQIRKIFYNDWKIDVSNLIVNITQIVINHYA